MIEDVTKLPANPAAAKPVRKPPAKARSTKRARGGEARAIADLVPAIGDTAFRKFGFVQSSIITRWPEIVGGRLARVTAPESLRFPKGSRADGTLQISVTSTHAVIVQHVIPDIIARVNQFFGYAAVAQIRLQQGRVERPAAAPPAGLPASKAEQSGEVSAQASDALMAIKDPELRAVLDGVARSLAMRDLPPKLG